MSSENPPFKGEKGEKGLDGGMGLKGLAGSKGETGDRGSASTTFEPVFINTFVGSDTLTSFVTQDTVDGGRKLAFPLVGNNLSHNMIVERHPDSTYMTLGSRIVLPNFGTYEYSFEVYVKNVAGAPQDIYVKVPLYNSGASAVLSNNHVVKNVAPSAIVKITGTGYTLGVSNAYVVGGPVKRTFFISVDSSTSDSFLLPNGNDDDFSGNAPVEASDLTHSLLLKKVNDLVVA